MNILKSHKLVFGIIGYGSIGKVHRKILNQLGYENYIYDPKIQDKKSLVSFSKLNKICNVIIISSPSYSHFYYLKYYSNKDKHIFIEKPFSHEIVKTKKFIYKFKKNKIILKK